jgi:hypothetical protein
MMLAVPLFAQLAAAAAVQSGQPAVATPSAPSASRDVILALACPMPGRVIAKGPAAANAFHTLNQEPDAAMIKPVARNYCELKDVVRTNVSGDTAANQKPPARGLPRIGR